MRLRDWMTHSVITVTPDFSVMKASKLLKENRIRRLPVVDGNGNLVGIVSDRDIKEASPSKATTLDVHEMYYLLSELKIKDIMTRNPECAHENDTVEHVALRMIERRVGGMPVLDDANRLVGIVTESDLFKTLVDISGVRLGDVQFAFELPTAAGTSTPILDLIRELGGRVVSRLTAQDSEDSPKRTVYIRIMRMEREAEERIIRAVSERFADALLYWTRDPEKTGYPDRSPHRKTLFEA